MKLALLIYGPSRPDLETVLERIKITKSSFEGYDYDSYFFSYNNELNREVAVKAKIDNAILLKRQSDESIYSAFPEVKCYNAKLGLCSQGNIWRLHQGINQALNFIENLDISYDFIVYARPCTAVKIELDKYLNKDYYNVVHLGDRYVDDRFAVGTPEVMKKVWGYEKDKEILKSMEQVDNDEGYLRLICDGWGIPVKAHGAIIYELRKEI